MATHETDNGKDIMPARRSAWRSLTGARRAVALIAALLALALLGLATASYAGYRYSQEYEGKMLPGTRVAGVSLAGMSRKQAVTAVKKAVAPKLRRSITVRWEGHSWPVTPQRLGATSNVKRVVHAALAASSKTSFIDKTRMRLLDRGFSFRRQVAVKYPHAGVRGFVTRLASHLDQEPADARIDYSSGWIDIVPGRDGREVRVAASRRRLYAALRAGRTKASLSVRTIKPDVTSKDFDQVLLVHIGANKLYLYENGTITHSWTVATGQPQYPTPQGRFEVTEKRYLPTWINPQPDTWGAPLPAEIPPGPGNPLGLRALNWSAPGIRFHGTSEIHSLGYNASHGCVRMSNADVVTLYGLVDVGTPIVSLQTAAFRPLYLSSTIDPTPVPDAAPATGHTSSGDAPAEAPAGSGKGD